ncbi:hypothetical protein ACQ86N_18580 [Puia sp. P3]|uniref:hypothetical protein n=1 Tax=Puia sp. P3 TaxID=3423952 RepID=UPI003D670C0C
MKSIRYENALLCFGSLVLQGPGSGVIGGCGRRRFITADIDGDGAEFVTEAGFFQLFNSGGVMIDNGKFLVLWKKTPEGWKMFRDSFSSDRDQSF